MDPKTFSNRSRGPEDIIQTAVEKYLRARGWLVKRIHASMYLSGFPDDYCTHRIYGIRWVEIKNPTNYQFTVAQKRMFPLLSRNGTGIWILTAANEREYKKLFKKPNWHLYLKLWSSSK